jgi:hypothetical protein
MFDRLCHEGEGDRVRSQTHNGRDQPAEASPAREAVLSNGFP